jgi:hypothetical protein
MITAKELINLIRYKLKDNNAVQYSDYDVMQGVNECLRYVNQYYQGTDFLEKVMTFDEDELNKAIDADNATNDTHNPHIDMQTTGVDLPDDFIGLVRIVRRRDGRDLTPCQPIKPPLCTKYKILRNKLYTGVKSVDMLYTATITGIASVDDMIELPVTFKDALCKLTCTILSNNPDTDTMSSAVQDVLATIVPIRRYTNPQQRMPFIV